jgi:hypothetical protein
MSSGLSNFQIPPPAHWQDFESLCCDLWRAIWKDPNTQKNARQGQPQSGVDIFGKPDEGTAWAGVQCKGRDNYDEKSLTEAEILAEVEKAKSFSPKLNSFTIATSGKRDGKFQELSRTITDKHRALGLFPVHIWSWDDILMRLDEYPEIIGRHYSELIALLVRAQSPKLTVACCVADPKTPDKRLMRRASQDGVAAATVRSQYRLQIIISNTGNADAKHARLIISFDGIDILKVIKGPNYRIDSLRNGQPTLQWDNPLGIVYANSSTGDVVWELEVKLHKNRWGIISWEVQAQDMNFVDGRYVLLGIEVVRPTDEIKPYDLMRYEDFWR